MLHSNNIIFDDKKLDNFLIRKLKKEITFNWNGYIINLRYVQIKLIDYDDLKYESNLNSTSERNGLINIINKLKKGNYLIINSELWWQD